jgi:hypothetical protein
LGTLTNGGEGSLEFVRYMAQELGLLLVEFEQA